MLEEIKKIIELNLPAEVSKTLQEKLKKADKDADEVKHLNIEIDSYQKEVQILKALVAEYKAFDQRNAQLDIRAAELDKIHHDLDLTILKGQLTAEKEKVEFTKSVALGLVRNTEYRKTILDSQNQASYWNGTNQIIPSPINKNYTETSSEG